MFVRMPVLLLVTVVWYGTVWCQPKVTIEVQPSSVEISPWYQRLQARVILQNAGTKELVRPELVSFTNDSFQVRIDPTPVQRLRPNETCVWTAWLENLDRARIPGTVQFDASYTVPGTPGIRHVYATLSVKAPGLPTEKPVEVSVQGSFDSITENRPGMGYLLIKNNLTVPVKISNVTILRPEEKGFQTPEPVAAFDVPPHSTKTTKITLAAASKVTPGKYVVVFDIQAEWDEGGHHYTRSLMVDKEANVGVFFESELLKALGVPSFLLLPGCLFLFTMQLLLTLGVFGVNRYSKVPDVPVTAPGFWIIAVTFSGLFAWVYSMATGTDYLVRYGVRDLQNVWLWSIVLGAAIYTLIALVTLRWRKQRVPNTSDGQLTTLEKMGRRGLGIQTVRVNFRMDNVDLTASLIERIEDGQTLVWVAPLIVTVWDDTNEARTLQADMTKQIDSRASPSDIATTIKTAQQYKPPYITEIRWETQNSIPNPYHLRVESITQYLASDTIVQIR
jgi:hypothetical protein